MSQSLYQLLHTNQVFKNLDTYAFGIIENYLEFKSLAAGEYLFYEGEQGNYVAFVVAGRLDIIKRSTNNTELVLATITTGSSIGHMALVDNLSRSADAKATEATGLVILPKKDFDRVLIDHPRIGVSILKGLATMLSLNLRRTSDALAKAEPV